MPANDIPPFSIAGACALDAQIIGDAYRRSAWPALIAARGDFVLAFAEPDTITLVSSLYAVAPYFYAHGPLGFAHGPHVADTAARAGLPLKIDLEALATLIGAGHTIGRQSLIEGVRRMPARAVVRFARGRIDQQLFDWDQFHARRAVTPEQALEAFNAAVGRVAGDDPVVSMSAGLDSRLILSSLLASGRKPALLTMGDAQSDDAQAAQFFATAHGLALTRRALDGADYLAQAATIASLGDGQKPADHWHGFLYTRDFQVNAARRLLIGANGEFARSYYLSRPFLPPLAGMAELRARAATRGFWYAKLRRHSMAGRYRDVLPAELRRHLGRAATHTLAARFAELSPGGLREGLDRFYIDQRVRHFIGYGLRLSGAHAACATPFLERDWVECAWNLPRDWKIHSNWHRFALARNAPQLLAYPETGHDGPMAGRLSVLSAVLRGRPRGGIPYINYAGLLGSGPILDALGAVRAELVPIFGEALIARVLADARAGRPDAPVIGLLLGVGHWRHGLQH